MLKRIILGALLSTAGVTGLLLTVADASHAQPIQIGTAAVETRPPMRVAGPNLGALQAGIAYWNRLAGSTVLVYVGVVDGVQDAQAVTAQVGDEPAGIAGMTQGNVGQGPLLVTVVPAASGDWVVWAHELGHTLGLGHHDEAGYRGVMRSGPQGYAVRAADDRRLAANM